MTAHPGVIEHVGMRPPQLPPEENSHKASTSVPDGLVDEMLAYYIDWRCDAAAVAEAYNQWSSATEEEEARRFSNNIAALDREESAATKYAVIVSEVRRASEAPRSVSDPV